MTDATLFGFSVLLLIAVFYFLPAVIASRRRAQHAGIIFFINLVFGWTVLGWIAALIWAIVETPEPRRVTGGFMKIILAALALILTACAGPGGGPGFRMRVNPAVYGTDATSGGFGGVRTVFEMRVFGARKARVLRVPCGPITPVFFFSAS